MHCSGIRFLTLFLSKDFLLREQTVRKAANVRRSQIIFHRIKSVRVALSKCNSNFYFKNKSLGNAARAFQINC